LTIDSPIFTTCSVHHLISNQLTPQGGGIFMEAGEDLIDLFLAVMLTCFELIQDVLNTTSRFLRWAGMIFILPSGSIISCKTLRS
jgi:hypothetical protein